jgi:hypothetical protein
VRLFIEIARLFKYLADIFINKLEAFVLIQLGHLNRSLDLFKHICNLINKIFLNYFIPLLFLTACMSLHAIDELILRRCQGQLLKPSAAIESLNEHAALVVSDMASNGAFSNPEEALFQQLLLTHPHLNIDSSIIAIVLRDELKWRGITIKNVGNYFEILKVNPPLLINFVDNVIIRLSNLIANLDPSQFKIFQRKAKYLNLTEKELLELLNQWKNIADSDPSLHEIRFLISSLIHLTPKNLSKSVRKHSTLIRWFKEKRMNLAHPNSYPGAIKALTLSKRIVDPTASSFTEPTRSYLCNLNPIALNYFIISNLRNHLGQADLKWILKFISKLHPITVAILRKYDELLWTGIDKKYPAFKESLHTQTQIEKARETLRLIQQYIDEEMGWSEENNLPSIP